MLSMSDPRIYTTGDMPPARRMSFWSAAVSEVFFPLESSLARPQDFDGKLRNWDMGQTSLTVFNNSAVHYRRERRHLCRDGDEQILVSFARQSPVGFTQNGLTLECGKGQFVIQRGLSPYEFDQRETNELWVLKLPADLLRQRLRSVDRYSTSVFEADAGAAGLLTDMLRALPRRLAEGGAPVREGISACLVELLAMALEADERVLGSTMSTVQSAHLVRIERYVRTHLADPHLSPETIARGCGISVRYVHHLCRATGVSLLNWVRDLRLRACDTAIGDPTRHESLAEIAYRWGFSDQAQFSRQYKALFGRTPSEARAKARAV